MKTYPDCIPCFFRQALDAARISGMSDANQKKLLIEIARMVPKMDMSLPPPVIDREIIIYLKKHIKIRDPYAKIKAKSIKAALKAYSKMKKAIKKAGGGLKAAVEAAIAGNIIDYGAVSTHEAEKKMKKLIRDGYSGHKKGKKLFHYGAFKKALMRAKTILYIADNAGETVFDRFLTEYIRDKYPEKKIIYAVKGGPAINDALVYDAKASGLNTSVEIISSGSDAPGTALLLCSKEFREIFRSAGMVISKGQGNYEALTGEKRRIFFLFVAKCAIIARHSGCRIGDYALIDSWRKKWK